MRNRKNQVSRRDFVKGTGSAAIAVGADADWTLNPSISNLRM